MQLAHVVSSIVVASFVFTASAAYAEDKKPKEPKREARNDDEEVKPFSASPLVGYATEGLKLGTGVRAGYTLPMGVYLGGTFVYHFGTSADGPGYEVSSRAMYPAGEVGYDFKVPNTSVLVRPYFGGGMLFASMTAKRAGQEETKSDSSPILYPGVSVLFAIPESPFFAGADARLAFVTESDADPSFGAFLVGGLKF